MLPNIYFKARNNERIQFSAYDKDLVSSDFIGQTSQLNLKKFSSDGVQQHALDLFDRKGKKSGTLQVISEVINFEQDPPVNEMLNYNCSLQISLLEATFLKDVDVIGKQDPFI